MGEGVGEWFIACGVVSCGVVCSQESKEKVWGDMVRKDLASGMSSKRLFQVLIAIPSPSNTKSLSLPSSLSFTSVTPQTRFRSGVRECLCLISIRPSWVVMIRRNGTARERACCSELINSTLRIYPSAVWIFAG